MDEITEVSDISTQLAEGKLLMAAIAFITTTNRADKTPDQVIGELNRLKDKIDFQNVTF